MVTVVGRVWSRSAWSGDLTRRLPEGDGPVALWQLLTRTVGDCRRYSYLLFLASCGASTTGASRSVGSPAVRGERRYRSGRRFGSWCSKSVAAGEPRTLRRGSRTDGRLGRRFRDCSGAGLFSLSARICARVPPTIPGRPKRTPLRSSISVGPACRGMNPPGLPGNARRHGPLPLSSGRTSSPTSGAARRDCR